VGYSSNFIFIWKTTTQQHPKKQLEQQLLSQLQHLQLLQQLNLHNLHLEQVDDHLHHEQVERHVLEVRVVSVETDDQVDRGDQVREVDDSIVKTDQNQNLNKK
jgi:hypothetical protein